MVSARLRVCDSVPLVACADTVKSPFVALADAPNTTGVLAPAAIVNGLVGLEVTPPGSAFKMICTLPLNPLLELMETLTAELVPPCCNVTELGETAREKSGAGGGGGCRKEDPPLHPAHASAATRKNSAGAFRSSRPKARPAILLAELRSSVTRIAPSNSEIVPE